MYTSEAADPVDSPAMILYLDLIYITVSWDSHAKIHVYYWKRSQTIRTFKSLLSGSMWCYFHKNHFSTARMHVAYHVSDWYTWILTGTCFFPTPTCIYTENGVSTLTYLGLLAGLGWGYCLPGMTTISPLKGVVNSVSKLINICFHLLSSSRISATSLNVK